MGRGPGVSRRHALRLPLPAGDRASAGAADEGLPDDALVLCGFNNGYKIEPEVFAVWCELLRRLPHAVLWIYQSHPQQGENLRRALVGAGIEPGRLVVSKFELDPARHLARLALADLFIDTFAYSAHTTMLDALYAGVPPVSVAGETTVGRLGASFVRAAGLTENVCADREAYVRRVLQLAGDAGERERQREHLRREPRAGAGAVRRSAAHSRAGGGVRRDVAAAQGGRCTSGV